MRLALVTDAWHPQTNGVVTTLSIVVEGLRRQGHQVEVIEPGQFHTLPCPGYAEIRLAVTVGGVGRRLARFAPDRVHVATEGPLGQAAVRFLRRRGWCFTTAFHTRFPEYIRARLRWFPLHWGYALLRRFHRGSCAVMVPGPGIARELAEHGFERISVWPRGVDTALFHPQAGFDPEFGPEVDPRVARPIFLFVGRLAAEKNVDAFLRLALPGTKVVVGDGPARAQLERHYPDAIFAGYLHGRSLAAWFASADVFVFPSRTDTFGIVMLEAMACGTPVAAFPVTGPADVVIDGETGRLDQDLARAAVDCLQLDRCRCAAHARTQGWDECVRFFVEGTVAVTGPAAEPPSAG